MTPSEQLAEMTLTHSKEITALQESTKSAHHRINENAEMTASIKELAKSVTEMASEIKHLTKRVDSSIEKIEAGQKGHGERIGEVEKAILTIGRNEKAIDEHEKRLDTIEKAPAHKWDKFMWLVFAGVAGAVITFVMSRVL